MSPVVVIVIAVAVVAVVVAVALSNRRRRADGVDSFRRQIDALSPEARRTVVDQVQNAADRQRDDDPDDPDDASGTDEGGARGS